MVVVCREKFNGLKTGRGRGRGPHRVKAGVEECKFWVVLKIDLLTGSKGPRHPWDSNNITEMVRGGRYLPKTPKFTVNERDKGFLTIPVTVKTPRTFR